MRKGTRRARSRSARSLVMRMSACTASAVSRNFWSSGSRHRGSVAVPPPALFDLTCTDICLNFGEPGGLPGRVERVLAEVVGERPDELDLAVGVDQDLGAAGGVRLADRGAAGIAKDQEVEPDVGVQHQA